MCPYKTANKSTNDALKCLRAWAAKWGLPYSAKNDSEPAFLQKWQEVLEKISVSVLHSTTYNPQSMGLVERSMRTLKELLKKNSNLSQLQLKELVYAINCR